MFSSIWNDLKREFDSGNMVTRLILVNVAAFVLINLIWLAFRLSTGLMRPEWYTEIVRFFSMPSSPFYLLIHPWTILTHMFLHEEFWHILWNMLYLYWFGRIVGGLIGDQRILSIYLLGGLAGGMVFFLSANLFPGFVGNAPYALGASAAVMAIAVSSATVAPDYQMNLLLIGPVKLKWIVGVLVLLDIILLGRDGNTGGHLAHLGGAIMGFVVIRQLQDGNDWTARINDGLDRIGRFFRKLTSGSSKGPKVAYRNPKHFGGSKRGNARSDTPDHQDQLDAILEKIKQTGYESLSQKEKDFLRDASKS
jgi:membrane associated rhomboid family serine protease